MPACASQIRESFCGLGCSAAVSISLESLALPFLFCEPSLFFSFLSLFFFREALLHESLCTRRYTARSRSRQELSSDAAETTFRW